MKALTFQFHIGAIRRSRHSNISRTLSSFNSILVQLEVCKALVMRLGCLRFNSILVQLEVE